MTTKDEHGSWVDGHRSRSSIIDHHQGQSQFGSGSQGGGHRERPQCVGCARGKVGAGEDGRPSHFMIIIVNIWKREMRGSCSTSGVRLPTVLGGGTVMHRG